MAIVRTRKVIDDAGATAVLDAAERAAQADGMRVVIAIVDPWGELVELRRTAGAQIASSRVAVDKARTAAIFVRPSREMEEQVTDGRIGALALHGASCLIGGIPLKVDGEVVGAIGTSGETPDEDEAISLAGAGADFSFAEVPALTYEGARRAAEAAAAEAAARCRAGHLGGRRRRRADVPRATRPGAGRERRRDDRQGADGGDLPPAEQGLRGPGGGRAAVRAAPRPRSAAAGRDPDRARRHGDRGDRRAGDRNGDGAVFLPAAAVVKRFESGGLLVDEPAYKVDAGRRERPGEVEYHERVTDVMHVVRGTATVLTGGRMRDAREVAPGELRAPALDGGTCHELREGDVLAIPSGVPHQFVDVTDPFLYFVVKVAA